MQVTNRAGMPASEPLLAIVDETVDYLVVDKPGELVCHPTKDGPTSSLIGRLRLHLEGTDAEPRFVNRLDRETSGLVVISKNRGYHRVLCRQMETARKVYLAVVEGRLEGESGTIDQPLGKAEGSAVVVKQGVRPDGRASRTHWRVAGRAEDTTLLEVELETGRMYQKQKPAWERMALIAGINRVALKGRVDVSALFQQFF